MNTIPIILLCLVPLGLAVGIQKSSRDVYGPLISDSDLIRNLIRQDGLYRNSLDPDMLIIDRGFITDHSLDLFSKYYVSLNGYNLRIRRGSYLHKEIELVMRRTPIG